MALQYPQIIPCAITRIDRRNEENIPSANSLSVERDDGEATPRG
jgi:hypothetical protein